MMQMKFLERNYFPFQIVQLQWTRLFVVQNASNIT